MRLLQGALCFALLVICSYGLKCMEYNSHDPQHRGKREIECKSGEFCASRTGTGPELGHCEYFCLKPFINMEKINMCVGDPRWKFCFCDTDLCNHMDVHLWPGKYNAYNPKQCLAKLKQVKCQPGGCPTLEATTTTTEPSLNPNTSETVTANGNSSQHADATSSKHKRMIGPLLIAVPIAYFMN